MKFVLKPNNRNTTDDELLVDLKKVADTPGISQLSSRQYDSNGGKYPSDLISRRFGNWNNAITKANLNLVIQRNISKGELFKNIENIWIELGRQPVFRDIKQPLSKYSVHHYVTKFETWQKALEAFVEFINSDEISNEITEENISEKVQETEITFKHKTKRNPSERLKVLVLMRDGNKCRLCGQTLVGEEIHFDHIKPWSKDGETTLDNLQILCAKHNLAKGDAEYPEK
jgi:hypothetical protein